MAGLSAGFSDVDSGAWYAGAVDYVREHGLMEGVGEGRFDPEGSLTRAMLVTVLWRQTGQPVVNYLMRFSDVDGGQWYTEAIRWAAGNRLVGGYGNGLFGPNDNLSRAQLVQILYNHAGRPVIQNGSTFTDAAPGAWYADAVAWAAAEGIISGYGGGRFGPNDPITREQLAVILWRYAGFPVPPNLLLDFPFANNACGYALDALRWAVEQGIISGYSNGRLEPKTPATRGQVAQILRNFLQKQ